MHVGFPPYDNWAIFQGLLYTEKDSNALDICLYGCEQSTWCISAILKTKTFFVHEANNSNNKKSRNHDSIVQSFGDGSLEPLSQKRYTFGTVFTVKEMETS